MAEDTNPRGERLDETHDPDARSWVESANEDGNDFPLQNLPFGAYIAGGAGSIGIAIGEKIVDLPRAVEAGHLSWAREELLAACRQESLDALMARPREDWRSLRRWASGALRDDADGGLESCLVGQDEVRMKVPARIGDYTDFYASVYHATNVGSLFRPDNPLLPNYKHVPIGYHGRSSTVVVSGVEVRRPCGQRKRPDEDAPSFGPCRLLDYEMEVGLWVGGPSNEMGRRVPIDRAEDRLFGLCLLNDWSARDVQAWEYQPLGPFLAKSFASSVSPWIVTVDALAPFRCPEFDRDEGDPEPLPYLRSPDPRSGFDVRVRVYLSSSRMREEGVEEVKLSETSLANLYWTPGQMITHHSSNGCVLNAGDLFGTGTVSGPEAGELGSLLEITRRGENPLELPDGTERKMLDDGDEVIMRAHCEADGARRIGFGECRSVVLPADC